MHRAELEPIHLKFTMNEFFTNKNMSRFRMSYESRDFCVAPLTNIIIIFISNIGATRSSTTFNEIKH
jgi:hypothetical protein